MQKRQTVLLQNKFTSDFSSHIKKLAVKFEVPILWRDNHGGKEMEMQSYVEEYYFNQKKLGVVCIIKSLEFMSCYWNKQLTTKKGSLFTKMFWMKKQVTQHYIYINDSELGFCCLKISSGLPFHCQFYCNGHWYLRRQLDKKGIGYKMQDNAFLKIDDEAYVENLKRERKQSKSTNKTYYQKACSKHWIQGNSIKMYNKGGYLLRVETTINNPRLPGAKLQKPIFEIKGYYWYGFGCNNRFFTAIAKIDASLLGDYENEFTNAVYTEKGKRVAAPDQRNPKMIAVLAILSNPRFSTEWFRTKELMRYLSVHFSKTAETRYLSVYNFHIKPFPNDS